LESLAVLVSLPQGALLAGIGAHDLANSGAGATLKKARDAKAAQATSVTEQIAGRAAKRTPQGLISPFFAPGG
jgi:hypothetical protein